MNASVVERVKLPQIFPAAVSLPTLLLRFELFPYLITFMQVTVEFQSLLIMELLSTRLIQWRGHLFTTSATQGLFQWM